MTRLASLPMYDWPEIAPLWDALWTEMARVFHDAGYDVAPTLTRGKDLIDDPDMLLAQICGWPLVMGYLSKVEVIGSFDFGLQGCASGAYNSVIIEGAQSGPVAVNDMNSQSGYAALCRHLGAAPQDVLITGAHRASIEAVADGAASIAAIDAVSWRLAEMYEPAAGHVRVIARTAATPGLPLVTRQGEDAAAMAVLVARALETEARLRYKL